MCPWDIAQTSVAWVIPQLKFPFQVTTWQSKPSSTVLQLKRSSTERSLIPFLSSSLLVFFGTMKAAQQRRSFQLDSSLVPLCPVTKACGVFPSGYGEKPRPVVIGCNLGQRETSDTSPQQLWQGVSNSWHWDFHLMVLGRFSHPCSMSPHSIPFLN